jgi:hypothetical protein
MDLPISKVNLHVYLPPKVFWTGKENLLTLSPSAALVYTKIRQWQVDKSQNTCKGIHTVHTHAHENYAATTNTYVPRLIHRYGLFALFVQERYVRYVPSQVGYFWPQSQLLWEQINDLYISVSILSLTENHINQWEKRMKIKMNFFLWLQKYICTNINICTVPTEESGPLQSNSMKQHKCKCMCEEI